MNNERQITARQAFDILDDVENGGVFPEWLTQDEISQLVSVATTRHRLSSIIADRLLRQGRERHRHGAHKTNEPREQAKHFARATAQELWENDTHHEIDKEWMIDLCLSELNRYGMFTPSRDWLWRKWLKESPSVIPARVSKGGRPRKTP